jgi:hypothetical protein
MVKWWIPLFGFWSFGCGGSDDTCLDDEGDGCAPVVVTCGEGTSLRDGACVPDEDVVCGEGTVFEEGQCVAVEEDSIECGEGTLLKDEICLPALTLACGPGTQEDDGECVASDPRDPLECGEGTERVGNQCVNPTATITCGEGTALDGSQCLPTIAEVSCGDGTVLANSECLPADTLVCGAGTYREGDECLPSSNITCGAGTVLEDSVCVALDSVSCGPGTHEVDDVCVPVAVTCGPGTRLVGDQCVGTVNPVPSSDTFTFKIAGKDAQGMVYFLDSSGAAVHRYDLETDQFVDPITLPLQAVTMAVAPEDSVYVGYAGGRIDAIDTENDSLSFLGSAPESTLWLEVAGDFLYAIDGSGAWETHSLFDRSTGARTFADDWRNQSNGAVYAPGLKKVFTFRDGTSPNDIYYEQVLPESASLGTDVESPYHGDYQLGHPIRVFPDETRVVVASGVIFNTSNLNYTGALGLSYVDLGFHDDRIYLLQKDGAANSKLFVLGAAYDIIETLTITGTPLRLFVHEDELTVFVRTSTAKIGVYSEAL